MGSTRDEVRNAAFPLEIGAGTRHSLAVVVQVSDSAEEHDEQLQQALRALVNGLLMPRDIADGSAAAAAAPAENDEQGTDAQDSAESQAVSKSSAAS
eukprot:scaffold48_cov311-Pinguiococcus_pyrenoidosus.AAC.5